MGKFDRYAFSAQPLFDEAETRKAFSKSRAAQDPRDLLLRSAGN
jgi:hypothetical protein